MDKDEVKKIFFELLTEDEDFKQRLTEFILNAVAEKFVEKIAQVDEPPKSEEVAPAIEQGSYSKEFVEKVIEQTDIKKVEDEREEFKRKAETLQQEKESAENQREEFKRKAETLQQEKESAENQREEFKRKAETLQQEKESAENQREEFKRKAETLQREKESAESQREEFKCKAETLQQEKESTESQCDDLKRQLAERFADGWEIYQKFLNLDISTRENSGMRTENFEAFICRGAQMKRLEDIWGATLENKRAGKITDAEILWEVFAYCVRLVNAAQGDNTIEILDTQIGEGYEPNKHSTNMTNSSTQGVVREIILTGYRNNISNKIVKKSNVRVG